jgi:hypothetical protein
MNSKWTIFQPYQGKNMLHIWWCPLWLDQHVELDIYSASSLKQQSVGRHVAPLGHIIPTPSQPVFALTPYCCMLSGEATITNFLAFGLTRPGIEHTSYRCGSCTFKIIQMNMSLLSLGLIVWSLRCILFWRNTGIRSFHF